MVWRFRDADGSESRKSSGKATRQSLCTQCSAPNRRRVENWRENRGERGGSVYRVATGEEEVVEGGRGRRAILTEVGGQREEVGGRGFESVGRFRGVDGAESRESRGKATRQSYCT